MKLKFRNQLAITYTVGILLLVAITSMVVSTLTNSVVRGELVAEGEHVVRSLAERSKLSLLYQSDELSSELGALALNYPNITGVKLLNADGKLVFQEGQQFATQLIRNRLEGDIALLYENDDLWIFAAPVSFSEASEAVWEEVLDFEDGQDGQESQAEHLGFVAISLSKQPLKEIQEKVYKTNIYVSVIVGLALLLLLVAMSRRLTNPLEQLAATMHQGAIGKKKVRAEIKGPADLGEMQRAFNTLMEALEGREKELVLAMNSALDSARVKGEFAANVTHELRTPMNAVLGMMELLLTMGLNAKQKEYVEIAKASGENLLSLIDDVLNFSQMDANKTESAIEDCCIFELLDDVVSLLAGQALKKGLDLGYVMKGDVPELMGVDASKLKQVLVNLMGNAIKFTKMGEVAVAVVRDDDANTLRFEVQDSGIGIPADDLTTIFEAFTQVDVSSQKEYEGTGLGLAISKQLVEIMGGDLTVESTEGVGSLFAFVIPFDGALLSKVSLPVEHAFQGKTAAFIDDSLVARTFAEERFPAIGVSVTTFENGLEGLGFLRKAIRQGSPPDVIFVDQEMPGIKGSDLCRLIQEEVEEQHIEIKQVLMVNPWSLESVNNQAVGATLSKPLTYNALYESMSANFSPAKEGLLQERKTKDAVVLFRNKKILVVDDNKPNQQVAQGMLHKLGCEVELAVNGKEAVEAILRNNYDVVIMDCHMPVLNGYDATRQIRLFEAGAERLPIIAMTANNSDEECERCLASGMDDFMPKPLRLKNLQEKLAEWIPTDSTALIEVSEGKAGRDTHSLYVDQHAISELADSVGEMITSIIEAFLEDTPVYIQSLKNALAQGDHKQTRELAHTIKGSASNFGANQLMVLGKKLEDAGLKAALEDAPALLESLEDAFAKTRAELEEELIKRGKGQIQKDDYQILIVDDDRSMRLALKNVFRDESFLIEEASTGNHALQMCERRMPDLILLDAIMPGIDGFKTCETIRSLPHGTDVPILMITALDNEDAITQAFGVGATDYIPKPIHFSVLKQRVSRLIQASKTEKHVKKLAYHDSLTGLPNRTSLMQHLRLVVNRAALEKNESAILFLDLDRFKLINDTLGHDTGDLLLKAVADRIARCVRDQDFVARLGGDEFTIILENIAGKSSVEKVAEKICDSLSQPFAFLQQTMFVTASIGISIFPEDGEDVSTLMKHADSAMFGAKEKRNGYCFYRTGMEDEIARRLEMERALRSAIKEDELVLYFQPQISATTGEILGAEALIRWQHKTLGMLSPAEFIPLAEETDLINEVGVWVLNRAIEQLSIWQQQGFQLKVAVNLSGRELKGFNLHTRISELTEKYQVAASSLEIEITETMFMENPEETEDELNSLRAMGVTLAIDDFGTGFSSLNYLKRLPVDVLKIDKSFVSDIETEKDDLAIVSGIIALAKSLSLHTVAEGVESAGQQKLLQDLSCDVLQGYYFGRPQPADEFEAAFLASKEPLAN